MTDGKTTAAPGRPPSPMRRIAVAALLSAGVAAALALGVARALAPPGYFTKYTEAAQASEEVRRARASDYSPLYLAMARGVVPRWGATGLLVVNVAAHALTCAAVAAVVALAAGWWWGLGAGVVAASYRPFLVYTAVLEPEMVLVALLACALLSAALAREDRGAARRWPLPLAGAAGIALGLGALARPAYLVLVPAWALWVAWHHRQRWRWRAALLVVAGAAMVIMPVLGHRWFHLGSMVLMDPGPVFYEGNGPQALGAPGADPELVKRLEALRAEGSDWGHVAYRELAAAGGASGKGAADSNRFWARLALEGIRAAPARAARRFLAKAGYALGPYEFHDLPEAEELDRRVRGTFPWGFSLLLVALIASLPGWRVAAPTAAGAAALGLLSVAVQVVFYASARQRLPLALAVLLVASLALARLGGVPGQRILFATLGGVAVAAGLAWHTAPLAGLREAQLSTVLGAAPPAPLAAWLDGRAWRRNTVLAAERVVLAEQLRLHEDTAGLAAYLAPALASDVPWLRGRARLHLARHNAARGAHEAAIDLACRAAAEAPEVLPAQALCAAGKGAPHGDVAAVWRPPGVDRTSARFAFARALLALGESSAAASVAAPVLAAFPELSADLVAP